jgi:hypothetical protein
MRFVTFLARSAFILGWAPLVVGVILLPLVLLVSSPHSKWAEFEPTFVLIGFGALHITAGSILNRMSVIGKDDYVKVAVEYDRVNPTPPRLPDTRDGKPVESAKNSDVILL